MKKTLLLLLAMCMASLVPAQYYVLQSTGTGGNYVYNNAGTNLLTTGNQVLSSWQTLPFTWNFYGTPVTGYYASDNGYITFDQAATTSDANNVALPSPAAPNNAIFAFWDDFTVDPGSGNPDLVRSWTYGTAPNRTHCIQWWSMTPTGTTAWVYMTIRIHEGGDFDIVQDYASSAAGAATTGTIGCQNTGGTMGTQVSGSPSLNFPALTNTAGDDIVYEFKAGVQPNNDLSVTSTGYGATIPVGNSNLTGVVSNLGVNAVTSFELNYRVDGGTTYTDNITGVNIPGNGGTYNFTHSTQVNIPTGGQTYVLEVWTSNPNNVQDDDPSNDMLTLSLLANNGVSANKRALMEEFTGAWCGYCPDGALVLDDIASQNPGSVSIVSIHSGDLMEINEGIRSPYAVSSYPSGQIDRYHFEGEAKVPVSRSRWLSFTSDRLNAYSPASVSVTHTYDANSRVVQAQVTADFVDYWSGDMRLLFMVVEDSVIGNGTGYNQVNYYSSQGAAAGGPSHPYYNAADPIVGYPHRHTLRAIPSGAMGNTGVVAAVANPGDAFSESFTVTLPASWDASKITLVGALLDYNADVLNHEVLNTGEDHVSVMTAVEEEVETGFIQVSPNPVSGLGAIHMHFSKLTEARFVIMDLQGRELAVVKEGTFPAGKQSAWFDATNIDAGVYFAQVQTPERNYTQKIVVIK